MQNTIRILIILATFCISAHAQQSTTINTQGSGAPSGTCASGSAYANSANGAFYICTGGSWASIFASPTFTGTATAPTFNATTTTSAYQISGSNVIFYPDADTSSLAVGLNALSAQNATGKQNVALGEYRCSVG